MRRRSTRSSPSISGQTVEQIRPALAYVEGRVDVDDVLHQIAWYRDHGFIKNAAGAEQIVDRRFVTAMKIGAAH